MTDFSDLPEPSDIHPLAGEEMRGLHPYHFRSGQWAVIRGIVPAKGRECYLVEFPDGVTDFWAKDAGDEWQYEFRSVS